MRQQVAHGARVGERQPRAPVQPDGEQGEEVAAQPGDLLLRRRHVHPQHAHHLAQVHQLVHRQLLHVRRPLAHEVAHRLQARHPHPPLRQRLALHPAGLHHRGRVLRPGKVHLHVAHDPPVPGAARLQELLHLAQRQALPGVVGAHEHGHRPRRELQRKHAAARSEAEGKALEHRRAPGAGSGGRGPWGAARARRAGTRTDGAGRGGAPCLAARSLVPPESSPGGTKLPETRHGAGTGDRRRVRPAAARPWTRAGPPRTFDEPRCVSGGSGGPLRSRTILPSVSCAGSGSLLGKLPVPRRGLPPPEGASQTAGESPSEQMDVGTAERHGGTTTYSVPPFTFALSHFPSQVTP